MRFRHVVGLVVLVATACSPGQPTTTTTTTTTSTVPTTTTTTAAPPTTTTTVPGALDGWTSLIGAGGWVTGITASEPTVVRTDTYGLYRERTDGTWEQLLTAASVPAALRSYESSEGVWEVASTPSYMYAVMLNGVWRSPASGLPAWTKVADASGFDANDNNRLVGQKMGASGATVLVGVGQLRLSGNNGATWSTVSIPAATSGFYSGITFTSPTTAYVSNGAGTYRVDTATGVSYATVGGPARIRNATFSGGSIYAAAGSEGVWKFDPATSAWTKLGFPAQWFYQSVVRLPSGAVMAIDEGGDSFIGSTEIPKSFDPMSTPAWLTTSGQWMSAGHAVVRNGEVMFAAGAGVWTAPAPISSTPSALRWKGQSSGIDQLVVNEIVDPPGATPPLTASWDFGVFRGRERSAATALPSGQLRFNAAWSLDYSLTNPNFVVAAISDMRFCCDDGYVDQSGYSTDGGNTWTRFASKPNPNGTPWGYGSIAVSSPDNMVWVPSFRQTPYYTLDRGRTWTPVTLPGFSGGGEGSHFAYFLNRHTVAADKVTVGTFYLYDSDGGLFRTVDGGRTWTKQSGPINAWSQFNAKLVAHPTKPGVLYFTNGGMDGADAFGAFRRSTDGGATWTDVPGVLEVLAFGFGNHGHDLIIAGWVNGTYGIWRSTDDGPWRLVDAFPNGWLAEVHAVEGDPDSSGVCVGFGGAGVFCKP